MFIIKKIATACHLPEMFYFLICNKSHKKHNSLFGGKKLLAQPIKQFLLTVNTGILQVSFKDILERLKQGH